MIRMAIRDTTLAGYHVPKGAFVLLDAYAMHHRPDYFTDPQLFDPQRFTTEHESELPRYAYLPFGSGQRICIGQHFAVMEAHLALAVLGERVELQLMSDQPVRPKAQLTLRTSGAILAIVHKR